MFPFGEINGDDDIPAEDYPEYNGEADTTPREATMLPERNEVAKCIKRGGWYDMTDAAADSFLPDGWFF